MKKNFYQLLQHLAAAVFIGLSVYGFIIFMGSEVNNVLPFWTSISLGLLAIVCCAVVVFMGGIIDRLAAEQAAEEKGQE